MEKFAKNCIGGWDITSDVISSSYNGYRTYLASASSIASGTNNWMRIYNTSTGTTYFSLDKQGKLFAQDATIKGTLQAGTIIEKSSENALTKIGTVIVAPYDEANVTRCYSGDLNVSYGRIDIGANYASIAAYKNISNTSALLAEAQVTNTGHGYLTGTWSYTSGSSGSLSDQRHKNTINDLTEKYSLLFDNLHPRTYKYNEGTSNRTHIGFIAQEVEKSIENSGLTSQEAALITKIKEENEDTETLYLRYEEIIALIVNELQKVKLELAENKKQLANLAS